MHENLSDGLTCLGPRVREEACLIWVDAICINQNDVQKRNIQVQDMRNIYAHATMVYGWLATLFDEDETFLAVQLIGKFRVALHGALEAHDSDPYEVIKQMASNDADVLSEVESTSHKGWSGIVRLFNEPYW